MINKTEFTNIRKLFSNYVNPEINKLLVLGCGTLRHEMYLNANHIFGIDWCDEKLEIAKEKSNAIVIKYDVRDIKKILRNKSFDCVAIFDFLEHLKKDDALELLAILECIIKNQIILYVPVQKATEDIEFLYLKQEQRKKQNLAMGHHLSFWTPEELQSMGFIGEYSSNYHQELNIGAIFAVKNLQ